MNKKKPRAYENLNWFTPIKRIVPLTLPWALQNPFRVSNTIDYAISGRTLKGPHFFFRRDFDHAQRAQFCTGFPTFFVNVFCFNMRNHENQKVNQILNLIFYLTLNMLSPDRMAQLLFFYDFFLYFKKLISFGDMLDFLKVLNFEEI